MATVPRHRAVVIGAGASGLVAAKYLTHQSGREDGQSFDTLIVEAGTTLGGTFANKTYDDTRLVSSTTLTAFSDFRFPAGSELHVSATEYIKYLEAYAAEFSLTERIQFGAKVTSVQPESSSHAPGRSQQTYTVVMELDGQSSDLSALARRGWCDLPGPPTPAKVTLSGITAIAVCSGLHNVPSLPSFKDLPGMEAATGAGDLRAIHSSEYKDRSVFENKNVLILGCGETAMDLAYRAANTDSCRSVSMNARKGLLSIPHCLGSPDRPLDVFITNLFEHSHEHPWVHRAQLRWKISGIVIRFGLRLLGSGWGFNQWAFKVDPVERGYHIINKAHQAVPHINAYAKRNRGGWLGRLSLHFWGESSLKPVRPLERTCIKEVCRDNEGRLKRVLFDNGEVIDSCDLIVFCTGYRQQFPFLGGSFFSDTSVVAAKPGEEKDEKARGAPAAGGHCFRHASGEDPLPPEHFIVHPAHPNVGFIGFVRPNVGAIPPMAELQTMWWLRRMEGAIERPEPHMRTRKECVEAEIKHIPSYTLLGNKYQYGVDYGNYMHRVAEDIGAAPSLMDLWRKLRLRGLFTFCMGQAYVSLFRIRGPFRSAAATEVTRTELYKACMDRGLTENLGLGAMTVFFAGLNLAAYSLEAFLFGVLRLGVRRGFSRYI